MGRFGPTAYAVALVVAMPSSVWAQQLDAEQVPADTADRPLQIEQPQIPKTDTLRVDQPSERAVDICEGSGSVAALNGVRCDGIARPPPQIVDDGSQVTITDDGVFLRLQPQNDDVYDPEEIARKVETPQAFDERDYGVGGVVTSTTPSGATDPDAVPSPAEGSEPFDFEFSVE